MTIPSCDYDLTTISSHITPVTTKHKHSRKSEANASEFMQIYYKYVIDITYIMMSVAGQNR